jgi:arsenate reductase
MLDRIYNILFLSRDNAARSIMAEAYLNSRMHPRIRAFSAGGSPRGHINKTALEVLAEAHIPTDNLRSKSWTEFLTSGARKMDLVIALCDWHVSEDCTAWPGKPATARWETPDPQLAEGSDVDKRHAFTETLAYLKLRLDFLRHFSAKQLENLARLPQTDSNSQPAEFARKRVQL